MLPVLYVQVIRSMQVIEYDLHEFSPIKWQHYPLHRRCQCKRRSHNSPSALHALRSFARTIRCVTFRSELVHVWKWTLAVVLTVWNTCCRFKLQHRLAAAGSIQIEEYVDQIELRTFHGVGLRYCCYWRDYVFIKYQIYSYVSPQ